jgi:ubiquinone/menaquinone biosynthesis C-methylase UbiE
MRDTHRAIVAGFYDTHPINEDEILQRLSNRSLELGTLTEEELKDFDQDHYGGVEAVEALAEAAGISTGQHVLDVGSGMGGPARWLAYKFGCRVTGLDLTDSRVAGAKRLTERVGLSGLVEFVQGDATRMPFPRSSFDALVSQEVWCHIPEKDSLLAECARVLKSTGKIAFTDIMVVGELSSTDELQLARGMKIPRPATPSEYRGLAEKNGLTITAATNLSEAWSTILVDRLTMYRSLRDTTVAKFGEERFQEYDRAYEHFVGLFTRGILGGYRVLGDA